MMRIDEKLTFEFSNSKISKINLNFPDMAISICDAKTIIYFYTLFQAFLSGYLDRENAYLKLCNAYNRNINGVNVGLRFEDFAYFESKKISESKKQYLRVEITNRITIAKRAEQDRFSLKSFEKYVDIEFPLQMPEEPLTFTRFQVQYYFNVLQKVSYKW